MRVQPVYPMLVVDPKGWLGLKAGQRKDRFSLLGALHSKRWTGYDSAGNQWRVAAASFPYRDTWWRRFLASTIYNPRFEAELSWEAAGSYSFRDLQALVCSLADKDDDLLTQWVERDDLKAAVSTCETFEELIRMLKSKKAIRG